MRNSSWTDYGIGKEERKVLVKMCQNTDSDTEQMLLEAAWESNAAMAEELFRHLHDSISFERLDATSGSLPIGKDDFYGYRRKTLYLFREKIMQKDAVLIESLRSAGYIRRYCNVQDAAEELQIREDKLREIAKKANAIIRVGGMVRINMIALYDYIDCECVEKKEIADI